MPFVKHQIDLWGIMIIKQIVEEELLLLDTRRAEKVIN